MKSAIVGCGTIAKVHAKVLEQLEGAQLTAVADILPERADEFAAQYGAKAYYDLDTMLQQEQIDVLHICTPHYLHTPMAVKALKKGIHVFMEKPPAISFSQWEELKKASADAWEKGIQLGICFQNRYNANVCYVKEQLAAGTYGAVLGVRGLVNWSRGEAYYTQSGWRGKWETEGGGALMNQSVHTLDLMQYLVGEQPKDVCAVMDNQHLQGVIEVEDVMAAYITWPETKGCFYATTSYVTNLPPLIELECEKARVRLEDTNVTIWSRDAQKKQMTFQAEKTLGKDYWGSGHFKAISEFYRYAEQGSRYPMNVDTLNNTAWLLLQIYQSAGEKYEKNGTSEGSYVK